MTSGAAHRVLIAEDDAVFAELLRFHLQRARFAVTNTDDGEKAWDLIQSEDFDALVTDVQMPGMNGIELSQKIRAAARTMPIVFVTAKALEFDVPSIQRELKISHVFTKPCAPSRIVDAVRECLAQS